MKSSQNICNNKENEKASIWMAKWRRKTKPNHENEDNVGVKMK